MDGGTRSSATRHDVMEIAPNTDRKPEENMVESEEEATILEEIESRRRRIMKKIID